MRDPVAEFQSRVPMHDYNAIFRDWWYRSLNGEPFVCWPGKVRYFALSSGTSEASSKHIPITGDMLRAIKKTSTKQIFSLARFDFPKSFYEKGILMLGGSTHLQLQRDLLRRGPFGDHHQEHPFLVPAFLQAG
jgi:hypothetical protein